jgi:hypothetical protein
MPKSPLSRPAHALFALYATRFLGIGTQLPNFLPGSCGSPRGADGKGDRWCLTGHTGEGDRDPMDETAGCLWAEDIADEILLFW